MLQGATQIVSDCVGDEAHLLEVRFVAVEHRVQDAGQAVELAVLAASRNALVEIAADDAPRGRGDGVDAREHRAVQEDGERGGDRQ